MSSKQILQGLVDLLNAAPTAWQAVEEIKAALQKKGFSSLDSGKPWTLNPGERYFLTRNGSSLAAFLIPKKKPEKITILGSHTDSPGLKLKPSADFKKEHMAMLGVEVYGGPLLNSWLNRDLGIAGRISCLNKKGQVIEKLVQIDDKPLIIPQLAIHLDKGINEKGLLLNKQDHLSALAGTGKKEAPSAYLQTALKPYLKGCELLAHDLFLFPLERAGFLGQEKEMIAGYRLDNLCSAHAALSALLEQDQASDDHLQMTVFWDNEEIGSKTAQGAASPFLPHLIERILLNLGYGREEYLRLLSKTVCVSVDVAHAFHPNYPEKTEPRHPPLLNEGIVLKSNAQQSYASDASSSATILRCSHDLKIPIQHYVGRNDIACGSTVGPITATSMGVATVDIGVPQLSMHSAREIIGCQDHLEMCRLLSGLYRL